LVIACCDSQVDPVTIFDTASGELFVIRNVANLVPPHELTGDCDGTSAAIGFAVKDLAVDHILVMGHAQCGGGESLSSRCL
jgi:carbonic anhydrase